MVFPSAPTFDDKYKERAYLKGKLAAAFRIFGKYGFDEGVAGHITLRVSFITLMIPKGIADNDESGPGGTQHLLGEPLRRRLLTH